MYKPTLLKVCLLFFTLALWSCSSTRQSASETTKTLPNTVLWEIQSKDLKSPSYLFGTIHLIPEDKYFWPDHFQKAYDATSQVSLETNELEMDPLAMMGIMPKIMLPNGQSLSDLVSVNEYQKISAYFDEMGLPIMFLKNIKPFFLYMLIDVDLGSLFGEGIKSYELEITEKAKQDNKPVLGLETLDYQISMFDSIPYQDQADLLVQAIEHKTLDEGETDGDDETNDLYQTYVDQDLNAILRAVQETDVVLKKFNKLFLENRNRDWIPKIENYIHQKPTFIAVGAAHLPGETGVIHLLEQAGYTLKPIMSSSDGTN